MADIKVSVRLSFPSGDEQVYSVQIAGPPAQELAEQEFAAPPYRFPTFTAPAEPALVESAAFIRLG